MFKLDIIPKYLKFVVPSSLTIKATILKLFTATARASKAENQKKMGKRIKLDSGLVRCVKLSSRCVSIGSFVIRCSSSRKFFLHFTLDYFADRVCLHLSLSV